MHSIVLCIFPGRPGAGKSTVSQAAVQLLGGGDANDVRVGVLDGVQDFLYIYLDLDVCIPQWMRVSGGINIVHVPSSISLQP
jgi:adenylylsulfate kinase-like enzyme